MYDIRATDNIPLWLVFLATVAIVVISIETGSWIARARRKHSDPGQDGPIGSAVGATLGLLAFMLAFTFGIAAARRDTKRELFLDEVTAISTTYLRTSLIPELHQSEVRNLLKEYVDLRVATYGHPDKLMAAIEKSKDIQNRLWTHVAALAGKNLKNPEIALLFIDSMNEMFDIQTKRVAVGFYHIPGIIWIILAALTVISMAVMGYQFGLSVRGNRLVSMGLALTFSMVILLIADLDRVSSGWLKVSNQSMVELQQEMNRE